VDVDRTRGNDFKLRQLDIRRKFFTQSVVMHWNRLLKKAVDAPSLQAIKASLDVACLAGLSFLRRTRQSMATLLSCELS